MLLMAMVAALLPSCAGRINGRLSAEDITRNFEHEESNSIYYWRTEFRLDSTEREFLTAHDIKRMYIRFFDVVAENTGFPVDQSSQSDILPNATIKVSEPVPASIQHVVPTVFITVDALRSMNSHEGEAASKIVQRVLNMVSYNEIPNVSELQLDCDWTETTDSIYFRLCRAVRSELQNAGRPFVLSSTIRLHQLRKAAPPVDYGVLMCYNTGSFRNPGSRNSILDYNDVSPYMRYPVDYPLHLDLALPIYHWTLCYRNNEFVGIIRTDSLFHTSITRPIENDVHIFQATANARMHAHNIQDGDWLRRENSNFNTIRQVTHLLDARLSAQPRSIILYHLDSENIKNFTDNEISQIYTRNSN